MDMHSMLHGSKARLGQSRWMALCAAAAGAILAGPLFAADSPIPDDVDAIVEQAALTAADGLDFDHLGAAVAISGETVVVGAPDADVGANHEQGAAYVFQRTGGNWRQVAKLLAIDGAGSDRFGAAVAIYGDTILVGVPGDDISANTNQGSAHVYQRSAGTWSWQAKLLAADGATSDAFGLAVALSGETALVGAPLDNYTQPFEVDMGAAYAFVRSAGMWAQQAKLRATAAAPVAQYARLGSSVALAGDTALLGAPGDDIGADADQGSAIVFVRSGSSWSVQSVLLAVDGTAGDEFGNAVALYADSALVGAWRQTVGGLLRRGAAYLYERVGTSFALQQKVLAGDGGYDDEFGSAVALTADLLVIGAMNMDIAGNAYQGAAYVYEHAPTGWVEAQKIIAAGGSIGDRFGGAIAAHGVTAVVGASQDSVSVRVEQGSARVLDLGNGAAGDQFGTAVAVSADTAAAGAWMDALQTGTGAQVGAVFVFARGSDGWSPQARLRLVTSSSAHFGAALALQGDTLVAGSPDESTGSGLGAARVWVRQAGQWREQGFLGLGVAGGRFGAAVALDIDTAAVGAPRKLVGGAERGQVSVHVRSGGSWSLQQSLVAADGQALDDFSASLSLDENTLAVGARGDDIGAQVNRGSVHVFVRSGAAWTLQQQLLAPDGQTNDQFGQALALSGDTLLVSAGRGDASGGVDQGKVYVWQRSGTLWSLQATLSHPAPQAEDGFGIAVALSGDVALVSAPYDDVGSALDRGSVYRFERSAGLWSPGTAMAPTVLAAFDAYGHALALDPVAMIVGAPGRDIANRSEQGAAWIFDRRTGAWQEQALVESSGVLPQLLFGSGFE